MNEEPGFGEDWALYRAVAAAYMTVRRPRARRLWAWLGRRWGFLTEAEWQAHDQAGRAGEREAAEDAKAFAVRKGGA